MMPTGGLADENPGYAVGYQGEYLRRDEAVVDHHAGLLDQSFRLDRQEIRIPGSGTDEIDLFVVRSHVRVIAASRRLAGTARGRSGASATVRPRDTRQ
jgi:hypothetical protein